MKTPYEENSYQRRRLLTAAFGLILLAIFLANGFLFFSIQNLSHQLEESTESDFTSLNTILRMRKNLAQVRLDLATYPSVDNQQKLVLMKTRHSLISQFESDHLKIAPSLFTDEEREINEVFVEGWESYLKLSPRFFELADQGHIQEATEFRKLNTNPAAQKVSDSLDKLMLFQNAEVKEAMTKAIDASKKRAIVSIYIETIAALFSIIIFGLLLKSFKSYEAKIMLHVDSMKVKNKELAAAEAKAAHNSKLASLGEMSAGIAHEINNPLAVIALSLKTLDRFSTDPDKFSSRVNSIEKSVERIQKIINGLRKFSRLADQEPRRLEDINILTNEALILTSAKAKNSNTAVTLDLKAQFQILCNVIEIEQVIINLVSNAIDAIKELDSRWIKIETLDENNQVVLRVTDSGSGISPELEFKIFDPFFTTKAVGQGTGLGLSITKGILDEHGATIILNRNYSNTCFEIRFQGHSVAHQAA